MVRASQSSMYNVIERTFSMVRASPRKKQENLRNSFWINVSRSRNLRDLRDLKDKKGVD